MIQHQTSGIRDRWPRTQTSRHRRDGSMGRVSSGAMNGGGEQTLDLVLGWSRGGVIRNTFPECGTPELRVVLQLL